MAKTIGIPAGAAVPLFKPRAQAGLSLAAIGRRWASFFERQRDRDIERYIQERGGVLTDGVERALDKYLNKKSTLWD
jgi:hypothetical protein